MTEVTKTYANGQKLIIYDDGVSDASILRARLVKVFTAADGETYEQTVLEGTETDLETDISRLTATIAAAQAQKTALENRKAALRTELNKLPAREVPS